MAHVDLHCGRFDLLPVRDEGLVMLVVTEQVVVDFIAAHAPGHVFNVIEVWYWMRDREQTYGLTTTDTTIRRYVNLYCERLSRGQYQSPRT